MDTTCKPEQSQTKEEESTQKPVLERPEFMEPAPSQSPTKSNSPKRKLKTE
jgi:hypothetical protein